MKNLFTLHRSLYRLPFAPFSGIEIVRATLLFALIALLPRLGFAANYYWVGSSGNWSDYANHWRIGSTGGAAATQVPTDEDNVFFTGDNYTVTIDQTVVYCKNMDWSGVGTKQFVIAH